MIKLSTGSVIPQVRSMLKSEPRLWQVTVLYETSGYYKSISTTVFLCKLWFPNVRKGTYIRIQI